MERLVLGRNKRAAERRPPSFALPSANAQTAATSGWRTFSARGRVSQRTVASIGNGRPAVSAAGPLRARYRRPRLTHTRAASERRRRAWPWSARPIRAAPDRHPRSLSTSGPFSLPFDPPLTPRHLGRPGRPRSTRGRAGDPPRTQPRPSLGPGLARHSTSGAGRANRGNLACRPGPVQKAG